jgi:hypothetical protein
MKYYRREVRGQRRVLSQPLQRHTQPKQTPEEHHETLPSLPCRKAAELRSSVGSCAGRRLALPQALRVRCAATAYARPDDVQTTLHLDLIQLVELCHVNVLGHEGRSGTAEHELALITVKLILRGEDEGQNGVRRGGASLAFLRPLRGLANASAASRGHLANAIASDLHETEMVILKRVR